jgi:NAD(P)-dependent dehydrogenase (short-subunit alcohol dehydrogenase family)
MWAEAVDTWSDDMSDRLKDKVAIVFGGGCGDAGVSNGAAAALAFAREGARVAVVDLDAGAAARTVQHIVAAGGQAIACTADVTSQAQVQAAVDAALQAYGTLHVLHNNVGLNRKGDPVSIDEAAWDLVMATNVKSLLLTCKAVIPVFLRGGGGAIVNISSVAGVTAYGAPTIAYGASKAAVNQFTRLIAVQYGPQGIRCNAIVAGTIDSPRASAQLHSTWQGDLAAMRAHRASTVPLRRLGTPADVAHAAVFLASDEAAYVTGVVMAVDGGLTCAAPQPAATDRS